jgi:predicted porin
MNKKLLAIAVGAALVAVATAATAGDEPTFYGKIHMSIDSVDNGGSVDGDDGLFVSSNSSRLGIKGAVDLDGGLKAVYKYEMSTNYSTADLAGNRNAYLGLKGGFGQVIAGRHDMPFKTVGRKHDLFGDTIGDHRAVTRAKLSGDDWADRRDDLIMYTNKFGAVGVKVAYGSEEKTKDSSDLGIGLDFKQGPLSVMYAHETHGTAPLTAGTEDSSGDILAGTYSMGSMTFAAGYAAMSDVGGTTADIGQVAAYTLGGAFKSGMNTFKLQYTSAETDVSDTASTILAVGVDHKLGKKTTIYAVYASISNDALMSNSFNSSGGHDKTYNNPSVAGDDSTGISVGMIHKF